MDQKEALKQAKKKGYNTKSVKKLDLFYECINESIRQIDEDIKLFTEKGVTSCHPTFDLEEEVTEVPAYLWKELIIDYYEKDGYYIEVRTDIYDEEADLYLRWDKDYRTVPKKTEVVYKEEKERDFMSDFTFVGLLVGGTIIIAILVTTLTLGVCE